VPEPKIANDKVMIGQSKNTELLPYRPPCVEHLASLKDSVPGITGIMGYRAESTFVDHVLHERIPITGIPNGFLFFKIYLMQDRGIKSLTPTLCGHIVKTP